jgi:hypothetical protein
MKALLVVLAACGAAPTPATSSDVAFDKLDHDHKIAFMKQQVVPAMKPLFQTHDAAKFGDFGCKTCHGKQAEDGKFDMPNPDLPKLDFGNMGQFKPADIAWMKTDIMPTMATLLKLPPHSEDNPNGFGCLGCHTQVGG